MLTSWLRKVGKIPRKLREAVFPSVPELLAHSIGRRSPRVECLIVPDIQPLPVDIAFAERLLKAYRLAADEAKDLHAGKDIWSHIRISQGAFLDVLDHGSPKALAVLLCNMSRHDATLGTVQGHVENRKMRRSGAYRRGVALHIKDKMVSLAEAIGALPCENPEQGAWGANLHLETDRLVELIEQMLGMDIAPPPIDGGLLKICSSRGLYHDRDLNALFTAWNLRQILSEPGSASLCEIGAGSGRVMYWSWRFGFRSLTTFDLPHINVIQSFYLHKAVPGIPLILHGEPEMAGPRAAIRPYFRFHADSDERFDLVLNQDSFPEIHADIVRKYLERIRQRSRRYFYHINHESRPPAIGGDPPQLSVPDLVAQVGGYRRLSRSLYWLRRGYVAELYAVNEPGP